jgi:tRNA dimethylallyltransferase
LQLAQRLNSIIISADSRQVYREFDIGTAKPSIAEQKLIPHYLIDICEPTETLTLAQYQEKAKTIIRSSGVREFSSSKFRLLRPRDGLRQRSSQRYAVQSSKKLPTFVITRYIASLHRLSTLKTLPDSPTPLLVGGTGLYIKSIVKGLKIPRVSPQPELRSQLQFLGQRQLYAMLCQVDAIASQKIHPNDEVRTLRALEVFYVTGKPISEQQGENPPDYPILQIGLDGETDAIDRRIERRTEKMIEAGLVEEVARLGQKYGWDLPLLETLGYQEIKQHLAGTISLSQAKDLIVLHTRQFAKRQRTWFRAYPEIEWFNLDSPDLLEKVWQRLQEFPNSCGK